MRLSEEQLTAMTATVTATVTDGVSGLRPQLDATAVAAALVAQVGDEVAFRTAESSARMVGHLDRCAERLESAERTATRLKGSLSIAGVGRVALALTPIAMIIAMLWLLVVPVAEVLGVGPLTRWAWGSFEAARTVGSRALIAALTLAVIGAVGYGIYRAGRWLYGELRTLR